MPRKKLVRRFEPRYGVSEDMLAAEAQYLGREVEDYRVYALADLKKMLSDRQGQWLKADGTLQVQFEVLPERERLIVQCLLVRDVYHLLDLYQVYIRGAFPGAAGVIPAEPEERAKEEIGDRPVPFSGWLFGPPA
jgi:hypothetical protein